AGWWSSFEGTAVVTLDELGPDRELVSRWLDRRGADIAVVRPDRCVLAAGPDLAAVTAEMRRVFEPHALASGPH
ncbi:hypothetical protein ACWF94_27650, partial [Streptomyces sp. NPDC055078]